MLSLSVSDLHLHRVQHVSPTGNESWLAGKEQHHGDDKQKSDTLLV